MSYVETHCIVGFFLHMVLVDLELLSLIMIKFLEEVRMEVVGNFLTKGSCCCMPGNRGIRFGRCMSVSVT